MSATFSEVLTPLSEKMPHAVRNIEILRVAAQLDGNDFSTITETARKAVLAWAKKRAGRELPPDAWKLQDFEVFAGGRNSTAVRIHNDKLDVWALRAEDPDKKVAGRVWSTEVVVGGEVGDRPHVSLRLVVSTSEAEFEIEPHVPGLVLQMVDKPGLVRGSRPLLSQPITIQTEKQAENLCDHLEDPTRRLPIFVVTLPEGKKTEPLIDDMLLAKATAGIARTFRVPSELTQILSNRFGCYRSVFNSGVRAYLRGFNASDDPFRHRLFVGANLREAGAAESCVRRLRSLAADISISETRLGKDVLDFAYVRTASRQLKRSDLAESEAPDKELLLKTAEDLVESLEKQLEEKNKEIDSYIAEIEAVEDRANAAERENRSLLFHVRQLQEKLSVGEVASEEEAPLPQEWSKFIDWFDQTYPDRVVLTPAARRLVRNPEFEDVPLVARAVKWLATVQHDRRVNGGGSLRDVSVENGVLNSPCGGDSYDAHWQGRRYEVDWHIKNGGNGRDPKRCLRIYYFWEPDTQQTVIDYLPGHRRTSAT